MKKTIMLLMVAGGLATQAVAAGTDNGPSASTPTTTRKPTVQQKVNQILQPIPLEKLKITRVGNISSRPWAQTAGYAPRTQFADDRYLEPHFNLYWGGSRPD